MVRSAISFFKKLERCILDVHPNARLIPTRFGWRRGGIRVGKLMINASKPQELLGKIYGRKYFQGFKIECSDETTATIVYNYLQEVFQWEN